MTRHGDRVPTKSYPYEAVSWNDCSVPDISYLSGNPGNVFEQAVVTPPNAAFAKTTWDGNCIPGQLTEKGMLMHKELGASLREIYINQLEFLPAELTDQSKPHLYVRSTNVWRTLQSAKSMLQGLYPASTIYNVTRRELPATRPILIETYHPDVETMDLKLSCKKYKALKLAMPQDPRFRKHMNKNKKLAERMDDTLHMIPPTLERDDGFRDLADGLACRLCHQKPMPCNPKDRKDCIREKDARRAMEMHQWEYEFTYRDYNKEFNSLGIGFFLGEFADALESLTDPRKSAANGIQANPPANGNSTIVPPGKFRFYSAHDNTLASILGALEASELKWPPFRSNMIFELWHQVKDDGRPTSTEQRSSSPYFVRMIYNGQVPSFFDHWCSMHRCPLDVFLKKLRSLVPKDPVESCKVDN